MKAMILSVCIVSLALNVCENLISGTNLYKQVKFVLSLILLISVFSPFIRNEYIFDLPDIPEAELSENYSQEVYNNELAQRVSENISAVLSDELKKNGISFDFIQTDINISDSDGISINKVRIGTDNFQYAEKIIKENLGEETEVINESQ